MSIFAMTIIRDGHIVFLEVGRTPGDVLTKASAFVNALQQQVWVNCNNVERFLEARLDLTYSFKECTT